MMLSLVNLLVRDVVHVEALVTEGHQRHRLANLVLHFHAGLHLLDEVLVPEEIVVQQTVKRLLQKRDDGRLELQIKFQAAEALLQLCQVEQH